MGQAHVHLAYSHASCSLLEYIPWIKQAVVDPIVVKDGNYLMQQQPGAGTTPAEEALAEFSQRL